MVSLNLATVSTTECSRVQARGKEARTSSRLHVLDSIDGTVDRGDCGIPELSLAEFLASSKGGMPHLDQITTSDDSSSVSSISSDEGDSNQAAPRAIFGRYWEKRGGASCIRRAPDTAPRYAAGSQWDSPENDDDNSSTDNTYERTLKVSEGIPKIQESLDSSRRKIFGNRYAAQSAPSLSSAPTPYKDFRKTQSTSALGQRRPKQSCLRLPRYSGGGRRRKDDDASSADATVRFEDAVDVRVFKPPVEKWASGGWSKYFS